MTQTIHVLDPSNFTPHYCIGLCNGLHDIGLETHLWASRWPYEDLSIFPQRFQRHNDFFKISYRLGLGRSNNSIRRLFKGAEYNFNLLSVLVSVKKNKKSILHVQWVVVPPVDRLFWKQAKRLKIPIVYTAHNVLPHDHHAADIPIYKWFYQQADRIIVHSTANREEMSTYFPEAARKVQVVPFGEFGSFIEAFPRLNQLEARIKLGIQPDDQVVLFFGLIAPYKGLKFLIKAVAQTIKNFPMLKLLIVGRPVHGSFAEYTELIQELDISDHVILHLGYVPTSSNNLYFAASDVCILPYVTASQSMTFFMACANAKPVIVTRVGGLPDFVEDGKSGLVVQPGSVTDLVLALRDFFTLSKLEQTLMGEYGKTKVALECSWQKIGQITNLVYQAI